MQHLFEVCEVSARFGNDIVPSFIFEVTTEALKGDSTIRMHVFVSELEMMWRKLGK